jgi:hypothetical protein
MTPELKDRALKVALRAIKAERAHKDALAQLSHEVP